MMILNSVPKTPMFRKSLPVQDTGDVATREGNTLGCRDRDDVGDGVRFEMSGIIVGILRLTVTSK